MASSASASLSSSDNGAPAPTKRRRVALGGTSDNGRIPALMIGTGEYTTGYAGSGATKSDKTAGVVALTLLDLKRRGYIGDLHLCGVNGKKLPAIRSHMERVIGKVYSGSKFDMTMATYPVDGTVDPQAFRSALKRMPAGSIATIFTPDDTHFDIALACIEAGLHVMLTKPAVQTLAHHQALYQAARKHNVLVCIEVHKRYDPVYSDARERIQGMGDFSYFNSYMSQPKMQLQTFKAWAGKSSDISFYLNSHHIDFHEWAMGKRSRPTRVTALCAKGVAKREIGVDAEDTISLAVQWENVKSGSVGAALYTSSWAAPKADVHSQQRFFYMGHAGEVKVDQAHRGYTQATDASGFASLNPLYMRYTPNSRGEFCGQAGYGYQSFEAFVKAVADIQAGRTAPSDYDDRLPTIGTTFLTTAILEAGRRSADDNGRPWEIVYNDASSSTGSGAAGGAGGSAGASSASDGVSAHAWFPTSIRPVSYKE